MFNKLITLLPTVALAFVLLTQTVAAVPAAGAEEIVERTNLHKAKSLTCHCRLDGVGNLDDNHATVWGTASCVHKMIKHRSCEPKPLWNWDDESKNTVDRRHGLLFLEGYATLKNLSPSKITGWNPAGLPKEDFFECGNGYTATFDCKKCW